MPEPIRRFIHCPFCRNQIEVRVGEKRNFFGFPQVRCEKCHAEGGTSAEDDAGILKGQWRPYVEYTMADFMNGKREMPKKMKKKVNQMQEKAGDEGMTQLLDFYSAE